MTGNRVSPPGTPGPARPDNDPRSGRGLTAVVVDASAGARRQVAGLLELGGWQVHEAASVDEALAHGTTVSSDLVVTDTVLPDGSGLDLLAGLRRSGSTARFLVVTAEPTEAVRARADAAGALACLAKPIDARLLLDLVERRGLESAVPAGPVAPVATDDLPEDPDAELTARLQEMYDDALPARLTAIAVTLRQGNVRAVVDAAQALAGTSSQLGHAEVAGICRAIAADARRGILAHHLVADLATAALAVDVPAGLTSDPRPRRRRTQVPTPRG